MQRRTFAPSSYDNMKPLCPPFSLLLTCSSGGERPTLAGFALMGPFYAHLYRGPVPGFLLRTRTPLVARWVERVMRQERAGVATVVADGGAPSLILPPHHRPGAAGADADFPPSTTVPVLRHLLAEFVPMLRRMASIRNSMILTESQF